MRRWWLVDRCPHDHDADDKDEDDSAGAEVGGVGGCCGKRQRCHDVTDFEHTLQSEGLDLDLVSHHGRPYPHPQPHPQPHHAPRHPPLFSPLSAPIYVYSFLLLCHPSPCYHPLSDYSLLYEATTTMPRQWTHTHPPPLLPLLLPPFRVLLCQWT